jgi:hypothetical protein
MAGTLKNVVALAAGFVDGMGYGANTKAAIMREGLSEMRELAKAMYPSVRDETFLESCGVADLIATCFGGRNRSVAEAWAKARCQACPNPKPYVVAPIRMGLCCISVLRLYEQVVLHKRPTQCGLRFFRSAHVTNLYIVYF